MSLGEDVASSRRSAMVRYIDEYKLNRAMEEPDKPLVTGEYSPKMELVIQCYADNNARPNEQIMHSVEKQWLPFANRQIKRLAT